MAKATNTASTKAAPTKAAPAPTVAPLAVAPLAVAPATATATVAPLAVAPLAVAPAAIVVAGAALYTYQPYNGANNTGWPVGQRGHRAFACQVAQASAKAHPGGFTLVQYRAALVASASASTLPLPKGGWARHNMPQWAAAQKWLVPVAPAKG